MRIGVVSDTHNNLGNVREIVELFNAARVEHVVHTGDITQAKTLEVLTRLEAPLLGVYGNNDQERGTLELAARAHGIHLVDPPLKLSWAEREIVVVHDPADLGDELVRSHRIVLHGHTHRRVIEDDGECLIFNPGECAGHLRGHNAIGVLDLVELDVELLRF